MFGMGGTETPNLNHMSKWPFEIELTEEQERRLGILARKTKMSPKAWLHKEAQIALKRVVNESDMVDLKEVARTCNVSTKTASRWYLQGQFPNAVQVNSRVVRIPRRDLEKFMKSRCISRVD